MFDAKDVDLNNIPDECAVPLNEGTAAGRSFAVSGGVANSVVDVIKQMDPEREVKVVSAQGLQDCKKLLQMAKAGKYDGYLLEGMGCPGGCVAGAGTLQPVNKSTALVNKYTKEADKKHASDSEYEITLSFISEHK